MEEIKNMELKIDKWKVITVVLAIALTAVVTWLLVYPAIMDYTNKQCEYSIINKIVDMLKQTGKFEYQVKDDSLVCVLRSQLQ